MCCMWVHVSVMAIPPDMDGSESDRLKRAPVGSFEDREF